MAETKKISLVLLGVLMSAGIYLYVEEGRRCQTYQASLLQERRRLMATLSDECMTKMSEHQCKRELDMLLDHIVSMEDSRLALEGCQRQ